MSGKCIYVHIDLLFAQPSISYLAKYSLGCSHIERDRYKSVGGFSKKACCNSQLSEEMEQQDVSSSTPVVKCLHELLPYTVVNVNPVRLLAAIYIIDCKYGSA